MNGMLRTSPVLFLFCLAAFDAAPATPTIDPSLSMKSAGGAQISPGCSAIAFSPNP
jgi:hypothetical protein